MRDEHQGPNFLEQENDQSLLGKPEENPRLLIKDEHAANAREREYYSRLPEATTDVKKSLGGSKFEGRPSGLARPNTTVRIEWHKFEETPSRIHDMGWCDQRHTEEHWHQPHSSRSVLIKDGVQSFLIGQLNACPH